MIYIISEDSGSGLSFWRIFFETYFEEYKIITNSDNSGNTKLMMQLDETLSNVQEADIVFIAFDKIYSTEGFDTADFLNVAREKCRRKGVKLFVTNYYCFEEIYLSYPELENMIRNDGKDSSLSEVAKYIREMIEQDLDYFQNDIKMKQIIEEKRQGASKNREHFADATLYILTKSIRNGYFTIDKSHRNGINKCWSESCEKIRETKKKDISYMCNNCCYLKKDSIRKDKLDDLCKKSCIANDYDLGAMNLFAVELL